ncbi:aldehyde dehydrogenase family protein [Thalassospira australica]|uniref:aldehyde dehydrogenase family protein n=1 Tax=Thalassospira australica TaxID=1528106 RepID=UPI00051A4836|nr:aldehyde dehydrogenase family protein [Thalassospira australica]
MDNAGKFYINGKWVDPISSEKMDVINPATEEVITQITLACEEDVDLAVVCAKRAFENYSQTSIEQRLEWLGNLLSIYTRRYKEVADTITAELGAPTTMSHEQQAAAGVDHLEDFIVALKKLQVEETLYNGELLLREPIGVCGLITPWNWPINQIVLKVIPALATGCTCVLKPSEFTPLNAMLYAEMIDEAGFPAGAFNLVQGAGPVAGSTLSCHPDITMMSFTGSTRAGKAITKDASENIKRVTLELGGKSPNIVFDDVDVEDRIAWSVNAVFNNSGQTCDAPTRMLVQRSIYDDALKIAKRVGENASVGDPTKDGDHIGPLVSHIQYDRVQTLIQAGIDEGATLLAGGTGKPDGTNEGYFVKPTIFADVNNTMRIAREEIFGPVVSIIPFDTEEEAIKIANDTPYGLAAYVQTPDPEKANRVARKLKAGMVLLNGSSPRAGSPFGGYKQSGNGREGGLFGLEDFMEIKMIHKL